MTSQLHYCETVAALHMLHAGGSLVLKKFTFFEDTSTCLLYLLCCTFKEVHVFKPITSKLGNSEVYVICLDYVGQNEILEYLDKLLEAYSAIAMDTSLFSESDVPPGFTSKVTNCAKYFMNHQIEALTRNEQLFGYMDTCDWGACLYLKEVVSDTYLKTNPIRVLRSCDRILEEHASWDHNIHPAFTKHRKWTGTFSKYNSDEKLDYIRSQLKFFFEQYCSLMRGDGVICTSNPILLKIIRVVKGVPFDHIGMSRFCFDQVLTLYITFANLIKDNSRASNVDDSDEVIYLKLKHNNSSNTVPVNEEISLDKQTESTQNLVKYLRLNYPKEEFIVQKFPDFRNPPSSNCKGLEYLYKLISDGCLLPGCCIGLVNCPLLTRLQNSLFVALSSCFDDIEMLPIFRDLRRSPDATTRVPIIILRRFNVTRSQLCVRALKAANWACSDDTAHHAIAERYGTAMAAPADGLDTAMVAPTDGRDTAMVAPADRLDAAMVAPTDGRDTAMVATADGRDTAIVPRAKAPNAAIVPPSECRNTAMVHSAEGAVEGNILELLDAHTLITADSHTLVCTHNALLLLAWATIIDQQYVT